jgi:hypothetical protein
MIIRCAPDVESVLLKKLEAHEENDFEVKVDPSLKRGEVLVEHRAKSVTDVGYVYAPYIPMAVTPTFVNPADFNIRGEQKKTPLQEAMEEIFKEEIESGELKPIWDRPQSGLLNKKWVVYKDPTFKKGGPLINPDFYGTVDVTNL